MNVESLAPEELIENHPRPLAYHRFVRNKQEKLVGSQIINVNKAFEEMVGVSKNEIIEKNDSDVYSVFDNWELIFRNWPKLKNLANNGDSFCSEIYLEESNCCYEATVYSIKSDYFGIVFSKSGEQKKSPNLLKGVFESVQDGISVLNTDLTIRYTNAAMEKWYAENMPLVEKKCFKAYHNRDSHCPRCPVLRSLESCRVESEVVPGLSGSEISFVELYSYPMIKEETGEVTGVVEFVRDITERKKYEEKLEGKNRELNSYAQQLRATEQQLRATVEELQSKNNFLNHLIESIDNPFYVINLEDYTVELANEAFGFKDSIGTGKCYQLTHRRSTPCESCPLEEIKKTGEAASVVHEHFTPEGKLNSHEIRAYPFYDENNNLTKVIEYAVDITERRKIEKNLAEERDMFVGGPVVVFKWENVEGWPVEYVSVNVQKILGYSSREFEEGQVIYSDIIYKEDLPRVTREVAQNSGPDADRFTHEPYRVVSKTGEIRWILDHTKNIFRNGKIVYRLGYIIDITDQQRQKDKLQKTNRELTQFANIVTHDLKQPLRTMASYADLLRIESADKLDDSALKYIQNIFDGTRDMKQLLDDLLAYTKLKTGPEDFETVNLVEILDTVKSSLEKLITETEAEVVIEDLPAVKGNRNQLERLFQNLIDNALTYRGEEPPLVKISGEKKDGRVEITVADNGMGMDPRFTDKIFDIFQRLHTDDEIPGTGIGLSICQKIVHQHHGEIEVETSPGEGTRFIFTLPVEQ